MKPISGKKKYEDMLSQVDPKILEEWRNIQLSLNTKLVTQDQFDWTIDPNDKSKPFLSYVK